MFNKNTEDLDWGDVRFNILISLLMTKALMTFKIDTVKMILWSIGALFVALLSLLAKDRASTMILFVAGGLLFIPIFMYLHSFFLNDAKNLKLTVFNLKFFLFFISFSSLKYMEGKEFFVSNYDTRFNKLITFYTNQNHEWKEISKNKKYLSERVMKKIFEETLLKKEKKALTSVLFDFKKSTKKEIL